MKFWKYIISILFLITISVWFALFFSADDRLHIVACDVGQGDAILIFQGKTQILIDGGPNNKVLECLGENIPFWDKEIELVVLTHPEFDHYQGLIEVFRSYKVNTFVSSSLDSSSPEYRVLRNAVEASQARIANPTNTTDISIGLIYLDILWPSQEYLSANNINYEENVLGLSASNRDANTFSIVAILRLRDFSALLTGDVVPEVAEKIAVSGEIGDVDYIKIPHHGSKNGVTKSLLDASSPEIAVISVGEKNSYGHPHKEVLDLLEELEITVKRTDIDGDVEIISDGNQWWLTH